MQSCAYDVKIMNSNIFEAILPIIFTTDNMIYEYKIGILDKKAGNKQPKN